MAFIYNLVDFYQKFVELVKIQIAEYPGAVFLLDNIGPVGTAIAAGYGFLSGATKFYLWMRVNYRNLSKDKRIRRSIANANKLNKDRSGIYTISGSRFELTRDQLKLIIIDRRFRIEFPPDFTSEMREVAPDFRFCLAEESDDATRARLQASKLIPDLESILIQSAIQTAQKFISDTRSSKRVFNGELFRVAHIHNGAEKSQDEKPIIRLSCFSTDYFSNQTILRAFHIVKEREEIRNLILENPTDSALQFFWNGLGLNSVVCAVDGSNPKSGGIIVLCKRSNMASENIATGKWHSTMNEAVSQSDTEDQKINIVKCLERGLVEEAGIDPSLILRNYFFNVVLVPDDMQPGICCLTFCNISINEIGARRKGSVDGDMEISENFYLKFDSMEISKALLIGGIKHKNTKNVVKFSPVVESILSSILARGVSEFEW